MQDEVASPERIERCSGNLVEELPDMCIGDEPDDHGSTMPCRDAGASGHLRVTVSPQNAKVDYVWSWLPQDDKPEHKHGSAAFSYDLKPH